MYDTILSREEMSDFDEGKIEKIALAQGVKI